MTVNIKIIVTSISILLLLITKHGTSQNYEWAKFFGGSGATTMETASDIALDENGNVYTVGRYSTIPGIPVDFNPGPGNAISSLPGSYISKLNEQGIMEWTRFLTDVVVQGYSIHASRIESIAIDFEGNIVISGTCTSGADLNAGPGVFTLPEIAPIQGIFIAKYSATGNFMWAKALPGIPFNNNYNNSSTLTTDINNNIILGLNFQGQIDGDPGPDTLLFDTGQGFNSLILKLTSTGNLIWSKHITGDIFLNELTTDVNGQIYSSGSFSSAVFDGFTSTQTEGLYDGYVLKLAQDGELVWVKTMGGISFDGANSLNIDGTGNVYCTGGFKEIAWFKNTGDSLLLIASGVGLGFNSNNIDGFTAKLDSNGDWEWAKSFGDSLTAVIGTEIEVDSLGNTYTLAEVSGQITFNRGYENVVENFIGTPALAIIKHDTSGNLIRVRKADGNVYLKGSGLELDAQGNLFFNGIFNVINNSNGVVGTGAIDMDPSSETAALVGFGNGQDCIFVAKWNQCSAGTTTTNETVCDDYTWNNETYTQSGMYSKSLTTAAGCDSIARLNLTVLNSSQGFQDVQICAGETFNIGNQTLTQSGIYETLLIAQNGCDSTVTTTLMILPASNSSQEITLCAGETYTINGETYSEEGIYSTTFQNMNGCDSTVTTSIFINEIQVQILIEEDALTAVNFPDDASLQWVDCENNFSAIENETSPQFNPLVSGNYAVVVSNGECSVTSDCLGFTISGLDQIADPTIKIFPNPTSETLTIESPFSSNWIHYNLLDNTGRKVMNGSILPGKTILPLNNLTAGFYTLQLLDISGKQKSMKIIKQ